MNSSKLSFNLKVNTNAPSIDNVGSIDGLYGDEESLMNLYSIQQQTSKTQTQNGYKSPSPSSPVTPSVAASGSGSPPQYNLVILDWDDTCFPTTTVVTDKIGLNSVEICEFGKCLYELFSILINLYGDNNIYIITNARREWVFDSLRQLSQRYQLLTNNDKNDYFAAIYNSLLILNINIISANDLYHNKYPRQPLLWKIKTFKQITINHFQKLNKINKYENCQYVILSIGDSEDEFTASLEAKFILKKQIEQNPYNKSKIFLHRIKLRDDPTIKQMMQQMIFLKLNAKIIKNNSNNFGDDKSGFDKSITLRL